MENNINSETMQQVKIHLNPRFKNAHINPNFLKHSNDAAIPPQIKIHINPKFLTQKENEVAFVVAENNYSDLNPSSAIVNTRRKLIRANTTQSVVQTKSKEGIAEVPKRIFTLTRNKLVRYQPQKIRIIPLQKTISKPSKSRYKIKNVLQSTFRIDRRSNKSTSGISGQTTFDSMHKKLVRININGVLYNSSKTKLQRSSSKSIVGRTNSFISEKRVLFVKGEKFLLDSSGTRLQKINSSIDGVLRKRIDIGGLTYIKNSSNNTFVRTDTHLTRNHLNTTKQRCISLLSRNLVKNNLSCPIYRRLGKCLAANRGRCPKLHDPKQVSICQRFLKGNCQNENCLLSHKISLSKMPTCKFFLKGVCVNADCPYLHKKVNVKTEICENFLKGFCLLAEKCSKRHEFVCPEFETNGASTNKNCVYLHKSTKPLPNQKNHKETVATTSINSEPGVPSKSDYQRYYSEKDNESETLKTRERVLAKVKKLKQKYANQSQEVSEKLSSAENAAPQPITLTQRPKLGTLPSYIPI